MLIQIFCDLKSEGHSNNPIKHRWWDFEAVRMIPMSPTPLFSAFTLPSTHSSNHYRWSEKGEGRAATWWAAVFWRTRSASPGSAIGCGTRVSHPVRYITVHRNKARSNELTRGPPELVQHFRFIGGVHIGARALHVLNLMWFGYIARGNFLVQIISTCPRYA